MSIDATAAIREAVSGLGDGNDNGDSGEAQDVSTVETTEAVVEDSTGDTGDTISADTTATDADPAKVVIPPVVEKTAEQKEREAELKALGVSEPVEGKAFNRIPQPRVNTMVTKAYERGLELGKKTGGEATERVQALERENQVFQRANEAASTDPDSYIAMLAAADPRYRKFLFAGPDNGGKQTSQTTTATEFDEKSDPKPQADAKFEDGSTGYSPEQHEKLLDWRDRRNAARVRAEMKAEFDKEFGPVVRDYKDTQKIREDSEWVQSEFDTAVSTWGKDLVLKYDADIAAAIKADTSKTPNIGQIVARVIAPKLQAERKADEATVRQRILAEQKARPAAAAANPGGGHGTLTEAVGEGSSKDAIRAAIRAAGLK